MDLDDEFLESFRRKPGDPVPEWAIKDSQNALEELMQHPFFMQEIPADPEANPALRALQAMMFDGRTPEDIARHFKNEGNKVYAMGAARYKDAIIMYTQGIDAESADLATNVALYANRAAVHLALENYASAVTDAIEALKLDSKNAKAHFRCAKGLLKLGKATHALKFSQEAAALAPNDAPTVELLSQIETAVAESSSQKATPQAAIAADSNARADAVLRARGIRSITSADWCCSIVDRPTRIAAAASQTHTPTIGVSRRSSGPLLVLPVVLLYPRYAQYDYLPECVEDCTVADLLRIVFEESASWDTENVYGAIAGDNGSSNHLAVFYESFDANYPLSNRVRFFSQATTLKTLLQFVDFALVDRCVNILVVPHNQPTHLLNYQVLKN